MFEDEEEAENGVAADEFVEDVGLTFQIESDRKLFNLRKLDDVWL